MSSDTDISRRGFVATQVAGAAVVAALPATGASALIFPVCAQLLTRNGRTRRAASASGCASAPGAGGSATATSAWTCGASASPTASSLMDAHQRSSTIARA